MSKSDVNAIKIIEFMTINDKKSEYNNGFSSKKANILDLDMNDVLLSQSKFCINVVEELVN